MLCVLAVLPTAVASGAEAGKIQQDCADDNALAQRYPTADLQKALKTLPADAVDYTDCQAVLRTAILRQSSGRSADSQSVNVGVGNEEQLSEPEREVIGAAIADAERTKAVRVGAGDVDAAAITASAGIPLPLLASLVLAGLGGVACAGAALRRRAARRGADD